MLPHQLVDQVVVDDLSLDKNAMEIGEIHYIDDAEDGKPGVGCYRSIGAL